MPPAEKADSRDIFELGKAESPPDPEEVFDTEAVTTPAADVGDGIEAEFILETTAVCPHCREEIERVQVVRMLRTKVNFVSSLPRRGQLLVCPKCRVALAGALGGLI